MATCKRLKDKYIKHLMSMDLDKLSMEELNTFASIIKILGDTERADYIDLLMKMMPVGGFNACVTDRDKEDKTDG